MKVLKLLILVLLPVLFIPLWVSAQDIQPLPEVEVDLWPEYDRPSMLVIYRITLPPQADYPYAMSFRIPSVAGEPHAIAARQPDGTLINLNYELLPGDEWSRIKFLATTPELQIEYYDPSLDLEGATRLFEYRWMGDHAVNNFYIQVQQPSGAVDMRISPGMGNGEIKSDGLVYFSTDVGSLPLGQTFSIHIEYLKETDELSAENIPIEPISPIIQTSTSRLGKLSILPWLVGGLGLLLIAGGAFWYWHSGREETPSTQKPRWRKPATKTGQIAPDEEHIYCPRCGKRAMPGDRFCRACGEQLHTG